MTNFGVFFVWIQRCHDTQQPLTSIFSLPPTGVQATADSALFIHQMIPHHENAVNTAKTLLKTGNLLCPDLTDTGNPDCVLEGILLEIVANQNHQIQRMQSFLETHRYPLTDNCDVYVKTITAEEVALLEGNVVQLESDRSGAGSMMTEYWLGTALLVLTFPWFVSF